RGGVNLEILRLFFPPLPNTEDLPDTTLFAIQYTSSRIFTIHGYNALIFLDIVNKQDGGKETALCESKLWTGPQ
ncbi:hypothetical protein AVEN_196230-1, partial [Araneus ventricosus]